MQGYLVIMESGDSTIRQRMAANLKDLMSDAELYVWDRTRTFRGVWLNQLEQGHCKWLDEEEKLRFHWALVWHLATSSTSALSPPGPCQEQAYSPAMKVTHTDF